MLIELTDVTSLSSDVPGCLVLKEIQPVRSVTNNIVLHMNNNRNNNRTTKKLHRLATYAPDTNYPTTSTLSFSFPSVALSPFRLVVHRRVPSASLLPGSPPLLVKLSPLSARRRKVVSLSPNVVSPHLPRRKVPLLPPPSALHPHTASRHRTLRVAQPASQPAYQPANSRNQLTITASSCYHGSSNAILFRRVDLFVNSGHLQDGPPVPTLPLSSRCFPPPSPWTPFDAMRSDSNSETLFSVDDDDDGMTTMTTARPRILELR